MTTADEAEQRKRVERARETGLFRYSLVQELTGDDPDAAGMALARDCMASVPE